MDKLNSHSGISNYLNGPLRARINDDKYVSDVNKVL